MSKKYVMITGVAGLLGSRLADWIIKNTEYDVLGIDDLSGGHIDFIPDDVLFFESNLSTEKNLDNIFDTYPIEYVFHFAAYAAEGLSPFIRCFNYQNNLVATANIVNACIRNDVKRLVFTSSMAVYGNATPPFSEDIKPQPIDPYGVAKYAAEMDIQIAGDQHGLDWCIIRPHNVYGINQNIWDKYRNVLGIWMWQHINGEPFTIFGDGEQTRAFSYIDDCLEPLWKSAILPEASREIINLGGIYHTTINDSAKILMDVIEGGDIVYKEARHEVKNAYPTYQKSVDILGFEHKTNLHDGLSKMWQWAKEQPDRPRFKWYKYEVEKGIYSFWK